MQEWLVVQGKSKELEEGRLNIHQQDYIRKKSN